MTLTSAVPESRRKPTSSLKQLPKVAVLAQIDARFEDSWEDPVVLEKVVSRRRFGGAVGQRTFRGSQGTRWFEPTIVAVESLESLAVICRWFTRRPQQLDRTARFRTQTGELILGQQSFGAKFGPASPSAFERLGSSNMLAISRSRCSMILKIPR